MHSSLAAFSSLQTQQGYYYYFLSLAIACFFFFKMRGVFFDTARPVEIGKTEQREFLNFF